MSWRDRGAGELRKEHVGETVTLAGWVARRRDHGGLIFVDLRDQTGIGQLVINPERAPEAAATAHDIRNEFVLQAKGEVVARAPEAVNPRLPTGEVEVQVDELEVISRSTSLPFQLDEENVDETLRYRYRWLDLRRERLQRNIRVRAQLVSIIREEMERAGFVDIETPIMAKPTPEGARDFLVPTRLQPGKFFALPQSPQIYKQLLVISGFERYYQIARCFRDEDLRADRLQELTQLDVESAFPDQEYIFELMERIVQRIWRETIGVELQTPFRRMSWQETELRFGSDKPDLRLGLEIQEATEITRGSEFGVFANAEVVRYLSVPRELSRAEIQKLEDMAMPWGAKGLAYIVFRQDGEVSSPIAKFLSASSRPSVSPARRHSSSPTRRSSRARCSGCFDFISAASSTSSTRTRGSSCGSRRCRCSSGARRRGAGRHSTIRSRARATTASRSSTAIPGPRAPSRTTSSAMGSSWLAARSESTSRSCRLACSTSSASHPRSSARSSASCSTRLRWEPRRTAESPRGSTG
jgi:aspartyl-tRNA synthetase